MSVHSINPSSIGYPITIFQVITRLLLKNTKNHKHYAYLFFRYHTTVSIKHTHTNTHIRRQNKAPMPAIAIAIIISMVERGFEQRERHVPTNYSEQCPAYCGL